MGPSPCCCCCCCIAVLRGPQNQKRKSHLNTFFFNNNNNKYTTINIFQFRDQNYVSLLIRIIRVKCVRSLARARARLPRTFTWVISIGPSIYKKSNFAIKKRRKIIFVSLKYLRQHTHTKIAIYTTTTTTTEKNLTE